MNPTGTASGPTLHSYARNTGLGMDASRLRLCLLPEEELDAPLVDENLRIGGWDVFSVGHD